MADCVCGYPEGEHPECERCRLISEIAGLKRDLFVANNELAALRSHIAFSVEMREGKQKHG